MIDLKTEESFEQSINKIIKNIKEDIEIKEIIIEFEKQITEIENKNKLRNTFYRKIIETYSDKTEINIYKEISNQILEIMQNSLEDQNKYSVIMDTNILLAIRLYFEKQIDESEYYFKQSIDYGEKNPKYSKSEFYNALNCAYSWLGVIYYNKNNFEKAYKCFDTAIQHYNEVKDDPNYFVKEKEVIKTCQSYINVLNNKG